MIRKLKRDLSLLRPKFCHSRHNLSAKIVPTGLEGKFDELVRVLKMNEGLNISKLSKGVL